MHIHSFIVIHVISESLITGLSARRSTPLDNARSRVDPASKIGDTSESTRSCGSTTREYRRTVIYDDRYCNNNAARDRCSNVRPRNAVQAARGRK